MRGLVAVAMSLLLVAACSGESPSARPSLGITNPIASAPTPSPSATAAEEATETPAATPTQTVTAEPTEKASSEPTETASAEPTEEASAEPSPLETAEATETPSEAPAGHVITVFAGGGGVSVGPGVAATDSALQRPTGVVIGQASDNAYLVDANLGVLATVGQDGTIESVQAGLLGPQGVGSEYDPTTNEDVAWVADTANSRVVTPNGHGGWTTIAGSSLGIVGFKGDGGPASKSLLSGPFDVAGPYIVDTTNQRVRVIDSTSDKIFTVAGNGTEGYGGDNGPPKDAEFSNPQSIAESSDGQLIYVADYGNFRIREISLLTGMVTTVAGTGDGTAVAFNSKLTGPETPIQRATAIAVDAQGNIFFPVFWSDRGTTVMEMAPDGTMTLIAGGGKSTTPGGDATDFVLPDILGLAINPHDGSLLICGSDGVVYTVAGLTQPAS